jgi:hypothetical protein
MGKNLKRTVVAAIVILLFATPVFMFAQAPPFPYNDELPIAGPVGNTQLEEVVFIIDGMMIILLATGIVYGAKKWYELHKRKVESPA